ncbi:MAG: hypothetical protein WC342_02310 [Methanoregula sp.]|jgi:hypothetical protein
MHRTEEHLGNQGQIILHKGVMPMQTTATTNEGVTAPGPVPSGALYSSRINPCEAIAGESPGTDAHEMENIPEVKKRKPSHCSPYVYEALRILEINGYATGRALPSGLRLPQTIIATKSSGNLIVTIVWSRKKVPDAKTLRELFPVHFKTACALSRDAPGKVMIWVTSPAAGWRYYQAYPGGIRYDWDFVAILKQ